MTKPTFDTWQRCLKAGLIPRDVRCSFKNPYPTKEDEQEMGLLMLHHEIGITKVRNLHNQKQKKDYCNGAIGRPSYKPFSL